MGVQSTDRSPQYFEILGRMTQMKMAKNRWFDVPFTRDESIIIVAKENKFQVLCMYLFLLLHYTPVKWEPLVSGTNNFGSLKVLPNCTKLYHFILLLFFVCSLIKLNFSLSNF